MIDVALHAGTKFAMHQWLQARGLGDNVQDTDAESPTFGDYFYIHDRRGAFVWWNHPDGKLMNTAPVVDGDGNVTTPATFFNGFWAMLRVQGDTIPVEGWIRSNTAIINQQGFPAYGGEGISVVSVGKVLEHLQANGIAGWGMLGGDFWTDPRAWVPGPAMTGDERDFDGQTYRSRVDFNHWSPDQAPETWELVSDPAPPGDTWNPSGATFEGVVGGGVIWVSDTSLFQTPEPIRIGTIEITANSVWTAGAPGILAVSATPTDLQHNTPNGTPVEVKR